MNRRVLLVRVRLAVGLPLLGLALPASAEEPKPADSCGPVLEISDENRSSVVAELAGERALGEAGFETRELREAWVEGCLKAQSDWPARCDLRQVLAFDEGWWSKYLEGRALVPIPPTLDWSDDKPDEPPCTRRPLVWVLTKYFPPAQSSHIRSQRSVRIDARTGELNSQSLVQGVACFPLPVEGPAGH